MPILSDIVVGRQPVLESLRAGKRVAKRLHLYSGAKDLEALVEAAGRIEIVRHNSRRELDRLSQGVLNQGVVLETGPLPVLSLDEWLERAGDNPLAVVLDEIEDPQNAGAIVRTAAGFAASAVIFGKDRAAPLSPAMVKASAGGVEYVDLVRVTNIARAIGVLRDAGIRTTGLAGEADASIWSTDLSGPSAIVIGSEGRGLRRLVRDSCDQLASIPMGGSITSFNASVSAAIAIAECARQRQSS